MADLPDETAAFINGLRALADFYEADPTFPLPYAVATPNQECRESFMVHGVDSVEDADDLTSRLGVDGTRSNRDDTVAYHDFGPVRIGLYIPEDAVAYHGPDRLGLYIPEEIDTEVTS